MTTTHTQEEKQKALNRLPPSVQEIIRSANTGEKIRSISRTYSLRVDQISSLEEQVIAIMLGLERPENFIPNLKETLKLNDLIIGGITKDVEEKIFKEIKSELVKVTENGEGEIGAVVSDQLSEVKQDAPKTEKERTEAQKEYDLYIKRRMEQMKALGDEEGIAALNRYLHGSIVDDYTDEIEVEVQAEMEKRNRERIEADNKSKAVGTVDLRNKRKLPPLEYKGDPRESMPKIEFKRPETVEVKKEVAKTKPSDGTEKIQEHPEEYLTFPYKKEDYAVEGHSDVDMDLDEMEKTQLSVVSVQKETDRRKEEIEPITTVKLNSLPEVEVRQKPIAPVVSDQLSAETTPKPVINKDPVIIDKAPKAPSILEQNLSGASVETRQVIETKSSDPYREPVE